MLKYRQSVPKSVRFKAGPPTVSVIPSGMETWENSREPIQEPSLQDLSSARKLAAKSLAEAEALERADARKARHAPSAKPMTRPAKDPHTNKQRADPRLRSRRPVPPHDPFSAQYSSSAPNPPYASRTYAPSTPRPNTSSRPLPTRAATDFKKSPPSDPFSAWEQPGCGDYRSKQSASPEDLRKKALESAVGFGKVAMEKFQQMRDGPSWKNNFTKFKKRT